MSDFVVPPPGERPAGPVRPGAPTPLPLDAALALQQRPVIAEMLAPLRRQAATDLAPVLDAAAGAVSETVATDLLDWHDRLVARLTNAVLVQRFTAFRMVRSPLWRPRRAVPGAPPRDADRRLLDAYVAWETLEQVLEPEGPYPELGRLIDAVRGNWRAAAGELFDRLDRHRDAVAAVLGLPPAALPPLTGARFGLSDAHAGGRSAAILDFGGHRLVYKPRSIRPEQAFGEVAGLVLEGALGLTTRSPRLAVFDAFGFVEHIAPGDCPDRAAVERCFRRYGALTAVAHGLGCCDLHHENVIVSGEHPVVIDAEPLFRARLALSEVGEGRLAFERGLSLDGLDARESVLELGILPMRLQPPLGRGSALPAEEYEIGALAAYLATPKHDLLPCAVDSDELQLRPWPVIARDFPNLPTLAGAACRPTEYAAAILEGFAAAHRFLRKHKPAFLAPGGLLDRLADVPVRLLARPTMDYTALLSRSLAPEVLTDTGRRRALVDSDLRLIGGLRFDAVAAVAGAEAESLMAADIPRFELRADAADATLPLHEPPLAAARARLAGLDSLDAALQTAVIRESLAARHDALGDTLPSTTEREAIERHALRFVDACVAAQQHVDGRLSWVYASYLPGLGATMNHADAEALYEGGAGTALLVAEAARLTGIPEWARAAAAPFAPLLAGAEPRSLRRSGGLARGLGGLVYALIRVAEGTSREDLLDLAQRLVEAHGLVLARQAGLDELLYGRAGLLLAVLALLARRRSARLEAVADAAAEALIERARPAPGGVAWPIASRQAMSNVSHGNAGIAMALARWAGRRGSSRGRATALAALAADDAFWSEGECGWIDSRTIDAEPLHQTNWGWCNGRSGGLLARTAAAEALGEPVSVEMVAAARAAVPTDVLSELRPGLCCGTPGALDALCTLHERSGGADRGRPLEAALTVAATEGLPSFYSTQMPALFSGSGGLAFALLRAARPDRVASVLWFD